LSSEQAQRALQAQRRSWRQPWGLECRIPPGPEPHSELRARRPYLNDPAFAHPAETALVDHPLQLAAHGGELGNALVDLGEVWRVIRSTSMHERSGWALIANNSRITLIAGGVANGKGQRGKPRGFAWTAVQVQRVLDRAV
jgi:hypothetical protein